MKKVLAVLLSALIVVLAIAPTVAPFVASAAKSDDAYAVIFTASDIQGGSGAYTNFAALLNVAKKDAYPDGPDGFLFGGDYTDGQEDVATNVPKVLNSVQSVYPGYSLDKMIFVQGNHDNNPYHPTGGYKFEHYNVFTLNIDDYPRAHGANTANETTIKNTAAKLEAFLEQLKSTGDTRPVFITAHTPMHHSIRGDSGAGDYGDTLYSKHVFDVVNEYAQYLDIVFLFGHNHSSTYDDYIGGSVNYIAKGETMRVPIPDKAQQGANGYTNEKLEFTYMNYGYVGYSGNGTTNGSTNTLTLGAIELCKNTMELTRYSGNGVYTTETIEKINTTPYIEINGTTTGTEGNSDVLYGLATGIKGTDYSWSTSDDSVVKVLPAGENAQVIYTGEGTADVTLTVTDKDGNTYSKTITIIVEAATEIEMIPGDPYTVYKLVNRITSGKKYIIASSQAPGQNINAISSNKNGNYLNPGKVNVLVANDVVDANYIETADNSVIWTAGTNSTSFTFTGADGRYLVTNRNRNQLTTGTSTTYNRWQYNNNVLVYTGNTRSNVYYNSSGYYTVSTNDANVYLYEETTITPMVPGGLVPKPYEPDVSFTKDDVNVNDSTLDLYNVKFGESFMIDGSFTGFSDQADKVTTTWTSSNPDVATVENGYVTTVGNGKTVITYTVTDGTTTITKSVTLSLSDEDEPVKMFALTDSLKNGNLYVIAYAAENAAMSSPEIDTGKTDHRIRHTATSVTIEDVNGVPSIYANSDAMVWQAIATADGEGFYLKNVQNGYYLYSNNDDNLINNLVFVTYK